MPSKKYNIELQEMWEKIIETSARKLLARKFKEHKIEDIDARNASLLDIALHGAFPYIIIPSTIPFKPAISLKIAEKNNEGFYKMIKKAEFYKDKFGLSYAICFKYNKVRKLFAVTDHIFVHKGIGMWFELWDKLIYFTELENLIDATLNTQ